MGSFEDVYRAHAQAVFRFALKAAGRRDVAEDLTSEAFLALYRNFDGIDQSQLPGWLIAVVRNRLRDWWRHQQVERKFADEAASEPRSAPPALDDWILESADLKPEHRTCLMLRYAHGMTRTEIAQRTGLTELQVKNCLQYGLVLLRRQLEARKRE
jgi:RNA polymerase sigma-70 factor (ECF subfamily)